MAAVMSARLRVAGTALKLASAPICRPAEMAFCKGSWAKSAMTGITKTEITAPPLAATKPNIAATADTSQMRWSNATTGTELTRMAAATPA